MAGESTVFLLVTINEHFYEKYVTQKVKNPAAGGERGEDIYTLRRKM